MKAQPARLRLIGPILLAALAVLLIWQVMARSFQAYVADARPDVGFKFQPTDAQTLMNVAAEAIAQRWSALNQKNGRLQRQKQDAAAAAPKDPAGSPAGDEKQGVEPALTAKQPESGGSAGNSPEEPSSNAIRQWLEQALAQEPLSARGLSLLGQLYELDEKPERAFQFYNVAAQISLQDWIAVHGAMRSAHAANDFAGAARYADAILRTHPQLMPVVAPTLGQMAENEKAAVEVKKLLANAPPWRQQFFAGIFNYIADARTPMHLLLDAKQSATPPAQTEWEPYLRFLVEHKFYDLAYYTWLQFLSANELSHVGLLFNAGFEQNPSGLPFDWIIPKGKAIVIELAAISGSRSGRALSLDFGNGRVEFAPVSQMTMLPPGTYKFRGKYKGEVRGPRGFVWRAGCAPEPSMPPIGESQMIIGQAPQWTGFEFAITVPAANCRAQNVGLSLDARSPSETMVTGSILFDELEISRQ